MNYIHNQTGIEVQVDYLTSKTLLNARISKDDSILQTQLFEPGQYAVYFPGQAALVVSQQTLENDYSIKQ